MDPNEVNDEETITKTEKSKKKYNVSVPESINFVSWELIRIDTIRILVMFLSG